MESSYILWNLEHSRKPLIYKSLDERHEENQYMTAPPLNTV